MTYHVRIRHGSTTLRAEYLCVHHGVFDADVTRTEHGDAPDVTACPDCDQPSTWYPSPVMGRVKAGEVVRGKSDPRPPGVLNTEALADGQDFDSWSKQVDKANWDAMRKKRKERL